MIVEALIVASSVAAGLPVRTAWAAGRLPSVAEVAEGDEEASGRCGVREVRLFAASSMQTATSSMPTEVEEVYEGVVERIEREYDEASAQGRVRLVRPLVSDLVQYSRVVEQVWVSMDNLDVKYLRVWDYDTGNWFVKLEDETTGQYLGLLSERVGDEEGNFDELLDDLVAEGMSRERAMEIGEARAAKRVHGGVSFEVNGWVMYLDRNDPAFDEDSRDAFLTLWEALPEGEARRRIERAIPVLWMANHGDSLLKGLDMTWQLAPDQTPFDPCLVQGAGAFEVLDRGGSRVMLEPLPAETVELYTGEDELPLPDSEWSFSKLVRKWF